jgi:flagellar hook-basal body complex protein FliE
MVTPTSMSRLTPINIQVEQRPGVRMGSTAYTQKNPGVQDSFADYLKAQINDVNHTQIEANEAVTAMVTGRSHNIHETMIALDKADVSFRMLMKVRNKAVEAYQEVMRMQI